MSKINFRFAQNKQPELAIRIEKEINIVLSKDDLFAFAEWFVDVEYYGNETNRINRLPANLPREMKRKMLKVVNDVRKKMMSSAHPMVVGKKEKPIGVV